MNERIVAKLMGEIKEIKGFDREAIRLAEGPPENGFRVKRVFPNLVCLGFRRKEGPGVDFAVAASGG